MSPYWDHFQSFLMDLVFNAKWNIQTFPHDQPLHQLPRNAAWCFVRNTQHKRRWCVIFHDVQLTVVHLSQMCESQIMNHDSRIYRGKPSLIITEKFQKLFCLKYVNYLLLHVKCIPLRQVWHFLSFVQISPDTFLDSHRTEQDGCFLLHLSVCA